MKNSSSFFKENSKFTVNLQWTESAIKSKAKSRVFKKNL